MVQTHASAAAGVAEQGALAQLSECQRQLDNAWTPADVGRVISVIDSALAVPAPDGSPAVITALGHELVDAARAYTPAVSEGSAAVGEIAGDWAGDRADAVIRAFTILFQGMQAQAVALNGAGTALVAWGENLQAVQKDYSGGRSQLKTARLALGYVGGVAGDVLGLIEAAVDPAGFLIGLIEARRGIASMVRAATLAHDDAQSTAATLTKLAGENDNWQGRVSNAGQAAAGARDTTAFSVNLPVMRRAASRLETARGEFESVLSGLGVAVPPALGEGISNATSASDFGSQVAGPWIDFGVAVVQQLSTAWTGFENLLSLAEADFARYQSADQESAAQIAIAQP